MLPAVSANEMFKFYAGKVKWFFEFTILELSYFMMTLKLLIRYKVNSYSCT